MPAMAHDHNHNLMYILEFYVILNDATQLRNKSDITQ